MNKSITVTPKNLPKKDFRKDGHCTAKVPEEKGCLYFKPVFNGIRELALCNHQNMGRVCEHKEIK